MIAVLPGRKYFSFVYSEIMVFCRHPASLQRGVARDRHDTRGGDAVDVTALAGVIFCADEQGGYGREIVWSWRPDAGAKFADQSADDGG
jgi:hypothetical protein